MLLNVIKQMGQVNYGPMQAKVLARVLEEIKGKTPGEPLNDADAFELTQETVNQWEHLKKSDTELKILRILKHGLARQKTPEKMALYAHSMRHAHHCNSSNIQSTFWDMVVDIDKKAPPCTSIACIPICI